MAGRISDASINAVRERVSIEDVVGAHVALRPAGSGRLRGLCPFHDEKTPSFNVNPANGLYHCFGCGKGGDAIGFVCEIEGLSFREAIERLARQLGIALTYEGGSSAAHRESGQRMRFIEAQPGSRSLLRGTAAHPGGARRPPVPRRARVRRGGGQAFRRRLRACRLGRRSPPPSRQGVHGGGPRRVRPGQARQPRFTDRPLPPPADVADPRFRRRGLGFGARRLYDDDPIAAKYLNTSETPLFKKSAVLYGADLARRPIAQRYQAVDRRGLHRRDGLPPGGCRDRGGLLRDGVRRGPREAAAPAAARSGRAPRRRSIFTFDGDAAGQAAARKALAFDQHFVAQTFVAIEPAGRDPCELRQQDGDAAVRDLIAQPGARWWSSRSAATIAEFDLDTAEGQVAAIRAAVAAGRADQGLGAARRVRAPAVRLDRHAEPEPVLERVRELAGDPMRGAGARAPAARPGAGAPDRRAAAAEREALKAALQRPGLCGPVFDALSPEHFTFGDYRSIFIAIRGGGRHRRRRVCRRHGWRRCRRRVPTTWHALWSRNWLSSRCATRAKTRPVTCSRWCRRVRELDVTRRVVQLKSQMQRMNPVEDGGLQPGLRGADGSRSPEASAAIG